MNHNHYKIYWLTEWHENLSVDCCITYEINRLQPVWYQEVILSNTTSSMRHIEANFYVRIFPPGSIQGTKIRNIKMYDCDKERIMGIHQKIPWLFPDFPISRHFPWLFTKFPDFSLTLKNKNFPWLFPDRWQPCVWPWPWYWRWIFKVKHGICYISAKIDPLATKQKENISIGHKASNVTISFDLGHDLDLDF